MTHKNSCKQNIKQLINELCCIEKHEVFSSLDDIMDIALPDRIEIIDIMEKIRSILFPGFFGNSYLSSQTLSYHMGAAVDSLSRRLKEQVVRAFYTVHQYETKKEMWDEAQNICKSFFSSLPQIRETLMTDLDAAFEGDPAVYNKAEILMTYPGYRAITNFRIANLLFKLNVPIIPRMITEHAHSRTGIDIHPGATIGSHFFIDHGTGVVIGETAILGNQVKIYQGVTLGAKSFPLDNQGKPIKGIARHPVLEDGVIVYAGATILGRVTIGKKSIIGGNVWLTQSVPENSRINQQNCPKKD